MEPRGIREHLRKRRDVGTRRKANSFAMLLAKLVNVWKFLSRHESDKSMMGLRRHSGMRRAECSAGS